MNMQHLQTSVALAVMAIGRMLQTVIMMHLKLPTGPMQPIKMFSARLLLSNTWLNMGIILVAITQHVKQWLQESMRTTHEARCVYGNFNLKSARQGLPLMLRLCH